MLREIRASGFTPARIEVRARGVIERDGSSLFLRVADRHDPFALMSGAQWSELTKRPTNPETEWVVTGMVEVPEDDTPLRLSVERIED